jgi:hypothetical protein
MTNMERIRSMNAGTLSDFLQNECMCAHCNHSVKTIDENSDFGNYVFDCGLKDGLMDCDSGCFDWLKSESE